MSTAAETFSFSTIPYLCQQRFVQLLDFQTARTFSKCSHSSNCLIEKNIGKIGKFFISDLFQPSKTNSIIHVNNAADTIADYRCYGITIRLFNRIFTLDMFQMLFPVWRDLKEVEVSCRWIIEEAFIRLIFSRIWKFNFRGVVLFLNGITILDQILYQLEQIEFVDVTFECFMYAPNMDYRSRFLEHLRRKFVNLQFSVYGMNLNVQTKVPYDY